MSKEKWYSISTPDQLIEAVRGGLRVECVRGSDVRTAEMFRGVIVLRAGNRIVNEASMTDPAKLRMWLDDARSQYTNWRVLDKAGRIPWRTLPV